MSIILVFLESVYSCNIDPLSLANMTELNTELHLI